jgi:anaerobic ribonucleoside-triphosphate reductase activating protein
MNLNLSYIQKSSSIYGPGERYVIWTQGCSLHCKGCWNKDTWSFKSNLVLSLEEVLDDIQLSKQELEGVTILGGEPLDQYLPVLQLIREIKKLGLSVMLYTGYELEEIHNKGYSEILDFVDILIPGRFEEDKRNTNLEWRGSENQKVHFLSERYINFVMEDANYIEITIDENGKQTILGYPEKELLEELIK